MAFLRRTAGSRACGRPAASSFSPVPPHNATSNFTKIVQRLPVRIHLEPGQEDARRLRVGMSVRPGIDVSVDVAEPPRFEHHTRQARTSTQ